jgi:hypothetical protein
MSWKPSFVQLLSIRGIKNKIGLKRFNKHGCRTYWQDNGVDFQMFGCSPLTLRQETEQLKILHALDEETKKKGIH